MEIKGKRPGFDFDTKGKRPDGDFDPEDIVDIDEEIPGLDFEVDADLKGDYQFAFYDPPKITKFAPLTGPSSGNHTVEIFGTGFGGVNSTDDLYIQFTGLDGTNYGVSKAYEIGVNRASVKTPPAPAKKEARLSVSMNGKDFTDIEYNVYSYYGAPIVKSISPSFGPLKSDEDRTLSITGEGFRCFDDACKGLKCKWDTKPFPVFTQAFLDSGKKMHCAVPKLARPETVPVEVSLNGHDYTTSGHTYTFFDAFVLDVQPKIVGHNGGTWISVIGYGFADTGDDLLCRFGSIADPISCKKKECIFKAQFVDDKEILCPVPKMKDMKYVNSGD